MLDTGIIAINREGIFSLAQAEGLLPVIRRITQDYSQRVEALMGRLEALNPQSEQVVPMEEEINGLIQGWHEKVKKLGAVPKGLWLVDFDCGDGYFCWKYPEGGIDYWHSYNDGFSGRVPIEKWLNKSKIVFPERESEKSPQL
ncbi:MAG: DUF2203 domain-containing protein [Bdellovibrionaceae bacterium]|nr:DUF2203 domain-containing protein [Bdellovibrionales bacterium]MCB9085350.1 DUF2203 domain-containing protein [Pseudobdellovibrionaceae bacterium]